MKENFTIFLFVSVLNQTINDGSGYRFEKEKIPFKIIFALVRGNNFQQRGVFFQAASVRFNLCPSGALEWKRYGYWFLISTERSHKRRRFVFYYKANRSSGIGVFKRLFGICRLHIHMKNLRDFYIVTKKYFQSF